MKQGIKTALLGVLGVTVLTIAVAAPQPAAAQSFQSYQQQYQFYGFQPRTDREMLAYLYGALAQMQRQVEVYERVLVRDQDTNRVRIIRGTSDGDGDGEFILEGTIDMRSRDDGLVFFAYGQDRDLVEDVDREDELRDIDEDGEDLQLIVVDRDLDGEEDYEERISGLEEDERYYYRICVEYEETDGDPNIACGNVKSFTPDDDADYRDDEPDVETLSARDITDDSAELRGEVDMNDFDDGYVFFVYGEDEDEVEDVEDEDEYDDIDERGDDLQKFRVDSDLDGRYDYEEEVFGLDSDTDHYFRLCVEYEDEDDDETLECGDIEDFETDND